MDDIFLSENFALSEFVTSQMAVRYGIDNTPPKAAVAELRRLALVLEQVRCLSAIHPIFISSGYSCPRLNFAVGGADNSAHVQGRAADITVPGLHPLRVCKIIEPHVQALGIDQLIYEGGWVHLALAAEGQPHRAQVLTATFVGGRARYSTGLPPELGAPA